MVVSRDPGSVPANWKPASENNIEGGSKTLSVTVTPDEMERRPVVAYCSQCQNGKPPRCHHCSVCQRCVLKMDHHCVWVVNSVGACNYKFFLLFVIELKTAPADYRFPTTNQSKHCFTRYIEFHRCIAAKGDESAECEKFAKYYRSLYPGEWLIAHL